MVALQILVLTVGVRILLGELKLNQRWFSFFLCYGSLEYRFSSSPSQGGETGSTPVGAITRIILKKTRRGESFFYVLLKAEWLASLAI